MWRTTLAGVSPALAWRWAQIAARSAPSSSRVGSGASRVGCSFWEAELSVAAGTQEGELDLAIPSVPTGASHREWPEDAPSWGRRVRWVPPKALTQ